MMYIPNDDTQNKILSYVDYNYRLKHYDIQINESTNQNSLMQECLKY